MQSTNKETINSDDAPVMRHRKITLADGRYMIFYTFGETLSNDDCEDEKNTSSQPKVQATEEKNV